MEPLQPMERRQTERCPKSGEVHLRQARAIAGPFEGNLIDASSQGFRIRHNRLTLGSGQLVDFEWAGKSGRARAVWTRIVGEEAETGFQIVSLFAVPADDSLRV